MAPDAAPPAGLLLPKPGVGYAERLEKVVGLGRLELPTSRLSSARSNQLSYKPLILTNGRTRRRGNHLAAGADTRHGLVREEREKKTAVSRLWGFE